MNTNVDNNDDDNINKIKKLIITIMTFYIKKEKFIASTQESKIYFNDSYYCNVNENRNIFFIKSKLGIEDIKIVLYLYYIIVNDAYDNLCIKNLNRFCFKEKKFIKIPNIDLLINYDNIIAWFEYLDNELYHNNIDKNNIYKLCEGLNKPVISIKQILDMIKLD